MSPHVVVFDLDGTLLDSDQALVAPFVALGVARNAITFGHLLADECDRLGVDIDRYLELYDDAMAQPYPGVVAMLRQVGRWAVCSNKHPTAGRAELARLGWRPEVALFSDAFDGGKELAPVLTALDVAGPHVLFVGDTAHDRACADVVGASFALAGWNPRARDEADADDLVLLEPAAVLDLLRR